MRTLALLLLLAPPALAAGGVGLVAGPGSRLWLEGTSTLHPYSSTATAVLAELKIEAAGAAGALAAAQAGKPASLSLAVPVAGLKSEHSGLDKNLRAALKAEEFPEIAFTLDAYRKAPEGSGRFLATGKLSVAGRSNPIELEVALAARDGVLLVEGEEPLLMTDYGIKPPKMMLGAIKTGDRVVVKFRLELAPEAGKAP